MQELAKNNKEAVQYFSGDKRYIRLKDGTHIFALLESRINFMGYDLDQLILFNDERWEIMGERYEFIQSVLHELMYRSCVPDDYMVLKYENIVNG